MEKEVLGNLMYQNNSVFLMDYLKINGEYVFFEVFGKSQIVRQIMREAQLESQSKKNDGGIKSIFRTNNYDHSIFIMKGGFTSSEIDVGVFGMISGICMLKTANIEMPKILFFKNEKEKEKVFNIWLNELPIPIPNDEELRKILLEILITNEMIKFSASYQKQIFALSVKDFLFNDHMAYLRNCIEIIYQELKIA